MDPVKQILCYAQPASLVPLQDPFCAQTDLVSRPLAIAESPSAVIIPRRFFLFPVGMAHVLSTCLNALKLQPAPSMLLSYVKILRVLQPSQLVKEAILLMEPCVLLIGPTTVLMELARVSNSLVQVE
jgi:hypothetical protein